MKRGNGSEAVGLFASSDFRRLLSKLHFPFAKGLDVFGEDPSAVFSDFQESDAGDKAAITGCSVGCPAFKIDEIIF